MMWCILLLCYYKQAMVFKNTVYTKPVSYYLLRHEAIDRSYVNREIFPVFRDAVGRRWQMLGGGESRVMLPDIGDELVHQFHERDSVVVKSEIPAPSLVKIDCGLHPFVRIFVVFPSRRFQQQSVLYSLFPRNEIWAILLEHEGEGEVKRKWGLGWGTREKGEGKRKQPDGKRAMIAAPKSSVELLSRLKTRSTISVEQTRVKDEGERRGWGGRGGRGWEDERREGMRGREEGTEGEERRWEKELNVPAKESAYRLWDTRWWSEYLPPQGPSNLNKNQKKL